jgi:asparagine synthase (glutamine-hydrolysing)
MCGIAGLAGGPAPDEALLERMAETMWKRGPDGHGIWRDGTAGLAATRLMVIDLHERSNQPLHLGPLHLVFNGELYNYKELREELHGRGHTFRTEGDAEVLLHAWSEWGEGALERANGMFGFAIWDDAERTLVLASDPFAEKPVYYADRDGRLVFASEVKALVHDDRIDPTMDEAALGAYIARGMMPEPPSTFFADILRLPAAHVLRWRDGKIDLECYWRPGPTDVPLAYDEAVRKLRELLLDSIRLRLRSDVPVGTSLSGGVDSSTIVMLSAALAGDHRRHAFTARFPGYPRDEWRYAEKVARRAEVVEHHPVEPGPVDLLADLEQFVIDQEEPLGSLSVYAQWLVMKAAREAGVVVLLDGQGGDELFGGYPIAAGFAIRSAGARAALRELVAAPHQAAAVGRALAMEALPAPAKQAYWRRSATRYASPAVVEAGAANGGVRRGTWLRSLDPLRRELGAEAFATSLPELLRYADRSSMAWSRELRLPLLDRRIAEFAFSLPPEFLYSDGASKRILRDVGRGLVPDSVLARRDKIGYEPPQERWLANPRLAAKIGDILLDPEAHSRGLYNANAIEGDVRAGRWRDPKGIWRALNAELWLRLLVQRPQPAQAR